MNTKCKIIKLLCLFLFVISAGSLYAAETDEVTTIIINNARRTEYKKSEETGNDSILLEGSVELTVQKGETVSNIRADKVIFDRKTEMLYGEGNVEIISKSASGEDITTAETILLNTSTLEGVFDDGRVKQNSTDSFSLPSDSVLVVFSDIFGKTNNNVVAFKNATLSFCDEDDPHWSIKSSRMYLLPGGEFAFLNALLFVGPVPVMYFPAFYYPKDELVFNPVFSYKARSGYSVQTTLYLYGRKPLDNTSVSSSSSDSSASQAIKSIQNFFKPSTLKNQELQGLMLHNTDKNYTGYTNDYLKIMADWYSKLGIMFGIDAVASPSTYVSNMKISANIAFSNTVFKNFSNYSNFSYKTGKKYTDDSVFLGVALPFRYNGNIGLTLSKPVTVNLSLPIYSDPFFNHDFINNRSESMDWIGYFVENTMMSSSSTTETVAEISSFAWKLTSSYSVPIPQIIKPYISSFSVSTTSQVDIASLMNSYIIPSAQKVNSSSYNNSPIVDSDNWYLYTPKRKFYYPSQITPLNANVAVSGTLFQWPIPEKSSSSTVPDYVITLNKPDYLKTDRQLEEERLRKEKESEESSDSVKTENEEEKEENYNLTIPALDFTVPSLQSIPGITYNLGYNISSALTTQMAYSSVNLTRSEDFKWDRVRSFMYTLSLPVSLTSTFNYAGNFFSCVNTLNYEPLYQGHPYISDDLENGGYYKSTINSLKLADYNAERQDITETNKIGFYPLTYLPIFSGTGISWNSSIKLFRRKFLGDIDRPEWENITLDWDSEECITTNNLNLVLSAAENEGKFAQAVTFSTVLPPHIRQYSATVDLTFPYVKASVSSGFMQSSKNDPTWKKTPLQQSLSVSLFNSTLALTESFNYNLEENYADSLKFSASWKGISAAYTMSYTYGYDFDVLKGWVARKDKEFIPYSASLSVNPSLPVFRTWFNRILFKPGINSSIVVDCIKPTSSYFTFVPSLSFEINKFLTFTFSATVRNSVIYRYVQSMLGAPGRIPGEENIFIDLIDSYRFDNENIRKGSGFKIKSLNFEINHNLHDWNFKMTFKMEPRLITEQGITRYDFNPYITIGVIWKPMEAVKTQIVDEYGKWKIE